MYVGSLVETHIRSKETDTDWKLGDKEMVFYSNEE